MENRQSSSRNVNYIHMKMRRTLKGIFLLLKIILLKVILLYLIYDFDNHRQLSYLFFTKLQVLTLK